MDLFERLVRYETDLWNTVSIASTEQGGPGLGVVVALRALRRHPGRARVQELSEALAITVSAASKFVDRLERDGLVARGPNPADRRSSLLTITDAGAAAIEAGEESVRAVLAQALDGADADRLREVLDVLEARLAELRAVVAR